MSLELYLAFVGASAIVLMVPGPTVLLIVAHALKEGPRATLPTTAGVVAGDALAVTVTLVGLGALLAASAMLFEVLKWLGVAYLIWLGIRTLMEKPHAAEAAEARPVASSRRLAGRAFIVTALNPKSVAFFVAFLPQFVDPAAALAPQLILMGATFVALAGLNTLLYAVAASRVAHHLTRPLWRSAMRWSSGLVLIGAGVMTAAMRRA
jgi:homoserine/homoserine lactone efflux protein